MTASPPLSTDAPDRSPDEQSRATPPDAKKYVLLVDDEELIHPVLDHFLDLQGYGVLHAMDGDEAVRVAREHRPTLILMDLMMPRLNGSEALRELRREDGTAAIPVIAMTAAVVGRTRESTLEEGFDGFVTKPFTPAQILAEIDTCLEGAIDA